MAEYNWLTVARFWSKVAIPENETDCWEWKATKTRDGYGRFKPSGHAVSVPAHRIAWEIFNGKAMTGEVAMHECDNPSCCNPAHIAPGTKSQNLRDAYARGLAEPLAGESNPRAKLTEEKVRSIRALIADGLNNKEIADRFGVEHSTISLIRNRKIWRHLA